MDALLGVESSLACLEDPLDLEDEERDFSAASFSETHKVPLCPDISLDDFQTAVFDYEDTDCCLPSLLFDSNITHIHDQQVPETIAILSDHYDESPFLPCSDSRSIQPRSKNDDETASYSRDNLDTYQNQNFSQKSFECSSDEHDRDVPNVNNCSNISNLELLDYENDHEVPDVDDFAADGTSNVTCSGDGTPKQTLGATELDEVIENVSNDGANETQESSTPYYLYDAESSQSSIQTESDERELDSCAVNDYIVPNRSLEE